MNHIQVFEYSALYRHIGTLGDLDAFRHVFHPITRQSILRINALQEVQLITPEVQAIINEQRQQLGLNARETNPISDQDRANYNSAMQRVQEE